MSIVNENIPHLADMVSVRDLVEGITPQEFSDEKVTKSMRYGDNEVCALTNKFEWPNEDKQIYKAVEAANYFAASNLIPKTIADRDTGKPLFITYKQLAQEICNTINLGLPEDEDSDSIVIISTALRNYYQNKNIKPFMTKEGFGGEYNTWQNEYSGVEGV
jgi:hypothetical protein